MAKQTTDMKIITSGAMQHLIRWPAKGRRLRVTIEGAGVAASVADDLGPSNDAAPFSVALRSLRVQRAQTRDQVIVWSGPLQYVMPFPAEGRLLWVTAAGAVPVASIADELGRPQDAMPFTCAFRSLQVDPVLDPDAPFAAYYPGVSSSYQHRSQYGDAQHAETSED